MSAIQLLRNEMLAGQRVMLVGPPGCIDGEAIITVNRAGKGFKIKLKDLVTRFNNKTFTYKGKGGKVIQSKWDKSIITNTRCLHNGIFTLKQISGAYLQGVKPVLKLILSDGKTLRLTGDHEVAQPNNFWTRMDKLKEGDSVLVNGSPDPKKTGRYFNKGYWYICRNLKNHPFFKKHPTKSQSYDMPEHRLIMEANLNQMNLEQWLQIIKSNTFTDHHVFLNKKQEVHHKDGNSVNNNLDNLEILSRKNHMRKHNIQRNFPGFVPKEISIKSIIPDGETEVFDITVKEAHNFVANGIVVHNCAKTAIIHATAKDCGYSLNIETEEGTQSTVIRAGLMERVDLTGCMVPDHKLGVTRQLPFSLIKSLQETKEKICLFIDDLGQAPIDVQASLMRLFDTYFLPPNVLIWAATNRPGDKAGVSALCEPLRSRFDSTYIVPTPGIEDKADGGVLLCSWNDWVDNWVNWALDNSAAPEIIAWHRSTNGKSLYAWKPHADPSLRMPDFRSWGAMISRWNQGLRSLQQIASVIGKAVAAEFLAFTSLSEKLPTPDQVWMDPLNTPVPTEPSAQWLIACVLSQQVQAPCAEQFIQYVGRMPRIMTAFAARSAFRRLQSKLSNSKAWTQWFARNQGLFNLGGE